MRILHAISSLDPKAGGPVNALLGLGKQLVKLGIDIHVLSTFVGDRPDVSAFERAGVRVTLVGPTTGRFANHPELAGVVATAVAAADIVHIHALWETVQHRAAVSSRAAGKPYIMRPCGMLDPWSLSQSKWVKRLYLAWRLRSDLNRAAAIHYTTADEMRLAGPLGIKAPGIVEPNGLDLDEIADLPPRGAWRATNGFDPPTPLICYLGRLHPKKGPDVLIRAMAKLRHTDAQLLLIGPGDADYVATLRNLVATLDLDKRVHFLGMIAGRERFGPMVDSDLFALPSQQENFGVSVVEAMVAGLPVLISPGVNLAPDVTAAAAGEVVPIDDTALAAAIDAWMDDPSRRRETGARAVALARERFVWDAIATRWAAHYERLAAGIMQR